MKMPLPPERARAFEAAGKQGCDCVAWSRKRRTGFISRQGVYESPRSSSHAGLRDKMGLLTKCLIIYYERKKAIKKTPTGV
ncbi:hypothetical protein, partial [Enterocloster lavalensis]